MDNIKEIKSFRVGLMTANGPLPINDNSTLTTDKREAAIFSSAFIAVFERLNYFIFSVVGETLRKIYDENKTTDETELLIKKIFRDKNNNKNALKKEDIINFMIELEYLESKDKEKYFRLKKVRDEIGHSLLNLLYSDEKFSSKQLIDLLKLFKKVLINIYNEFLLPTYKDCLEAKMKVGNPFEIIFTELAVTDTVLSSIIDRKKHIDVFKVLEED